VAKRTAHLHSVRPHRKPGVKSGPDERPALVKTLCGQFVAKGRSVRFDRVPASVTNLCEACRDLGKGKV